MKKLLSIGLIAGLAMAGNFYVGAGADITGSGTRTYDDGYNSVDIDFDRTDTFFAVGYKYDGNKRIELEYRNITVKNENNSDDKDDITSIGVNFIIHRHNPIWRLKPYLKTTIAYVENDVTYTDITGSETGASGIGFGLGLGTYVEITKKIELSINYNFRVHIYEDIKGISTSDRMGGIEIGGYYHF